MQLKYLYDLITGNTKATKPAKITLRNIWAVIQAKFRKIKAKAENSLELPGYLYEQIIWRRTQVQDVSPVCWDDGNCIICGCNTVEKTMEDRPCEGSCYPKMMSKEKWEEYKKLMEIKLFD